MVCKLPIRSEEVLKTPEYENVMLKLKKKKKKLKKNTIKKKKKVPLFTNLRVVRALQPLLVSWRRTLLTPGVTGVLGHTLSL